MNMPQFKKKRPTVEYYHCNMCHKDLTGGEFDKQPAGYEKDETTGKLTPHKSRFSIFCNFCRGYLGFLDTSDSSGLNKPIN
jgi:hypothetical protein